jgi:hypothetical protein
MLKPSDLIWDDVVRVGAATRGGKYLRSFWWPVALSEDVRDVPVPVKLLGEELVLFRDRVHIRAMISALLGWLRLRMTLWRVCIRSVAVCGAVSKEVSPSKPYFSFLR